MFRTKNRTPAFSPVDVAKGDKGTTHQGMCSRIHSSTQHQYCDHNPPAKRRDYGKPSKMVKTLKRRPSISGGSAIPGRGSGNGDGGAGGANRSSWHSLEEPISSSEPPTDNPSYFTVAAELQAAELAANPQNSPDEVDCARAWRRPSGPRAPCKSLSHDARPRRAQLRALLRSLSEREGTLDGDEGILQGRPRPGDIAPSPGSECGNGRPDDVFYTIPLQARRRHSLGTYLNADAPPPGVVKVTTVPSGVPTMEAPRPGRRSTPTSFASPSTPAPAASPSPAPSACSTTRRRQPILKEMEDIVIVSSKESPESELWSDYLITCFDKIMSQRARHHYRVTPITAEEMLESETSELTRKITKAQLQILILCPKIASKLSEINKDKSDAETDTSVFKTDNILVMLLGVDKEDITSRYSEAIPSISSWPMMVVRERDTSFVDALLSAAVGVLRHHDRRDTPNDAQDKTTFSIVPKKVKLGQSRVITLLNDPVREEDSIKIIVDRKGEPIQITSFKKRNPYTLQFDIPDSCLDVSMLIWIRISKNGQSLGRRQIKCESRLRELDQILRATEHPLEFMCQTLGFKSTDKEQLDSWMLASFQRNIPPHFNLLGSSDPYTPNANVQSGDEYPTLLHFAARHGLERLAWQLLECPGGEAACAVRNVRRRAPADLARDHRHDRLAAVLQGHCQMNEFSNMYYYLKNMTENGDNPQDFEKRPTNLQISEDNDEKLCVSKKELNLITPTSETSTDLFSEQCLQNLESKLDTSVSSPKCTPKRNHLPKITIPNNKLFVREQLYQNDVCFPAKPIQADPSFENIKKAIEHDYLVQPSNIKVESPKAEKPNNLYCNNNAARFAMQSQNRVFLYSPTEENKPFTIDIPAIQNLSINNTSNVGTNILHNINTSIKDRQRSCSGSISGKSSHSQISGQDELAEIISDFKNNVFSIAEVEALVREWRGRNETLQSLQEKREQLDKMRHEYEKLQKRIKENMKRPTPFERVKKIFSKGKSKIVDESNGAIEKRNCGNRPNSSLSESSSSSGRLSTVSGGSLGESSAQSDFDDKRISTNTLNNTLNESDYGTLDNYSIPPPPRPLNGAHSPYTPSPTSTPFTHTFSTFQPNKDSKQHTHMATIAERDSYSQSHSDIMNSIHGHNRIQFDGVYRTNSLPEGHNDASHMYMNITPS